MAHGQPDFGAQAPKTTTYSLPDMAELAARLGSIVTFDRRGDVVYLDDFESAAFKWLKVISSGGTAVYDTTYPRSGAQCVKLDVTTDFGSEIDLLKGFPLLLSSRVGGEISFSVPDNDTAFRIALEKDDGAVLHLGTISIDFLTGALAYLGDDGAYHTFATVGELNKSPSLYHTVKLVVDFNTDKYVRFLYAGAEYDLSAYTLYTGGYGGLINIFVSLILYSKAGGAGSIYIDDYILTQNEP